LTGVRLGPLPDLLLHGLPRPNRWIPNTVAYHRYRRVA